MERHGWFRWSGRTLSFEGPSYPHGKLTLGQFKYTKKNPLKNFYQYDCTHCCRSGFTCNGRIFIQKDLDSGLSIRTAGKLCRQCVVLNGMGGTLIAFYEWRCRQGESRYYAWKLSDGLSSQVTHSRSPQWLSSYSPITKNHMLRIVIFHGKTTVNMLPTTSHNTKKNQHEASQEHQTSAQTTNLNNWHNDIPPTETTNACSGFTSRHPIG